MSTSTEPGAYVWRRPAYYSYRTCGVYPYLWAVDEQDQQRGFHTVNGLKAELFRRGYGITKPKPNGVFGQSMRQMVIDFQIDEGLKIDGTVGPITARRLARDLIQLEQLKQDIPHNYLAGLFRLESLFDPGAQGIDRTKSTDRGWAQISDESFSNISDAFAYGDLPGVVEFGGNQLRLSKPSRDGLPYAEMNRWDCAILHHNTPVGAKYLFENGKVEKPKHGEYIWFVAMNANLPW